MNTAMKIPDGSGGDSITELTMSEVYRALSRIEEIAIINAHKAPELLSCFARAFATLTDHLSVVSSHVVKATNALNKIKSIIILDRVPAVLREKGMARASNPGGSEDQRNAVLEMDVDFQRARDRLQELEAYYELLKGKQKDVENAYLGVRKIIGGDSYQGRNPNLGSSMPANYAPLPPIPGGVVQQSPRSPSTPQAQGLRANFGTVKD